MPFLRTFLATAIVMALLGSSVLYARYFVIHVNDQTELLRYQLTKLEAAKRAALPIDTVFVGDSSLGNAIDADLYATLTGRASLSLALSGGYGYSGSVNMAARALDLRSVRTVILMQTVDVASRAFAKDEFLFTSIAETWGALPFRLKWRVLSQLPGLLTRYTYIADTFGRLARPDFSLIGNDYVVQRGSYDPARMERDSHIAEIKPDNLVSLEWLAERCRAGGIRCLYVHGPLYRTIRSRVGRQVRAVNDLVKKAGLPVLCPMPLALDASTLGNAADHVAPDMKTAATRRLAVLLDEWQAGLAVDCAALDLPLD